MRSGDDDNKEMFINSLYYRVTIMRGGIKFLTCHCLAVWVVDFQISLQKAKLLISLCCCLFNVGVPGHIGSICDLLSYYEVIPSESESESELIQRRTP